MQFKKSLCHLLLLIIGLNHYCFAQWTPTTPLPLGSIYILAEDVTTDKLYAGTAGFGLYESEDEGANWNRFVGTGLNIKAVLIKDGYLFWGTSGAGLLRSDINIPGLWDQVLVGEYSAYVETIIVFNGAIYVGCASGYVYRSFDNGGSWEEITTGLSGPYTFDITSFVEASDNLFLGRISDGIYKLSLSGNSWEKKSNGLSQYTSVLSLESTGGSLFAGTTNEGVYVSSDNGESWSTSNTGLPTNTYVNVISTIQGEIFAGLHSNGVYKSIDNGSTWNPANSGINGLTVHTILEQPNYILVGTEAGVYGSSNSGMNWIFRSQGINAQTANALLYNNGNLFAGAGNIIFKSADLGNSWEQSYRGNDSEHVEKMIATDYALYAAVFNGKVIRSTNEGNTWQKIGNGINSPSTEDIIAINNNVLFTCNEILGVFRSDNNGDTWVQKNTGLPLFNSHYRVLNLTSNEQHIFATATYSSNYSDEVYKSSNLGENWQLSNNGLPAERFLSMVSNGPSLFVGMKSQGIFRSINNGSSWNSANNGIPSGSWVYHLKNHYGMIVAGIYHSQSENNGFYYSTNNGSSWLKLNDGLPLGTNVGSSELVNSTLYIGTSSGIFYQVFDGFLFAPNHLVALAEGHSIQLSWTDNSNNEDGFDVERKIGSGGNWQKIATVGTNITSFADNVNTTNQNYYYRVSAFKGTNHSSPSNEYYAITMDVPTNLTAETISSTQINLSWVDNTDSENGYKIERMTIGEWSEIADLPANSTSYENTDLSSSTTYSYRARAYANSTTQIPHYSEYSNEANATTESVVQEGFLLSFPLAGQNPYTASINSVFDHSMSNYYNRDNTVIAFTGEKGEKQFGYSQDGYAQESGEPFIVNGNYTAAGLGTEYLFYDGHPGIDYRAATGTPIYAPADGEVIVPGSDPVNGNPTLFNTIMIKHNDEYSTWYLHCNKHLITAGAIERGIAFAEVGSAGTEAPHLHFEVRKNGIPFDPYSWQGTGSDPYVKIVSEFIWSISTDKTIWDFSESFEMWRTRDALNKGINQGLGGKWVIDPGDDPGIISPILTNINAFLFPEVEIRMSVNGNGETDLLRGNVYFTTQSKPEFSMNQPVEFDRQVVRDGNQYIYKAYMETNSDWNGSITSIRIDPVATGSASNNSDLIYIDYIRINSVNYFSVIGNSPIDLVVIDPNGSKISKDTIETVGASYIEADFNLDGEFEDVAYINNPEIGIYQIFVLPEPGALPTDTYSLYTVTNGDTTIVVEDALIMDIPPSPYESDYFKSIDPENPPKGITLFQNYPNPFNSSTKIKYSVSEEGLVALRVYDIQGKLVRTIFNERMPAGTYVTKFHSQGLSSGLYIYQITSGKEKEAKKMLFIK